MSYQVPKSPFPTSQSHAESNQRRPRQVNTNAVKSHQSIMSPPLLLYLRYPDAASFPAVHSHGRRQNPPASTVIGLRGASCQRPPRHPVSAVGPRQRPWRRIVHAVDRPRGWHGRAGEQVRHEEAETHGFVNSSCAIERKRIELRTYLELGREDATTMSMSCRAGRRGLCATVFRVRHPWRRRIGGYGQPPLCLKYVRLRRWSARTRREGGLWGKVGTGAVWSP